MTTKVFISWSGDLSKQLGEALRGWLPSALQFVKPYFSPQDIEKGTKWDTEISKELESSHIGVICLTSDNIEKPWILFEAGALSKSIEKSRVCTLLFNIESSDVKGPLTNFQATRFVKNDFQNLFVSINNAASIDTRLDPKVLDNVFDMWWPKLENDIESILNSRDKILKTPHRSDRDILEELLELMRIDSKRVTHSHIRMSSLEKLVDLILEAYYNISRNNGKNFIRYFEIIMPALKQVCMDSGTPELANKINLISNNPFIFKNRKNDPIGVDVSGLEEGDFEIPAFIRKQPE